MTQKCRICPLNLRQISLQTGFPRIHNDKIFMIFHDFLHITRYNFSFFLMRPPFIYESPRLLTPCSAGRRFQVYSTLVKLLETWLRSKEWYLLKVKLFSTDVTTLKILQSISTTAEIIIFQVSSPFPMIAFFNLKIPIYFHDWKSYHHFSGFPGAGDPCVDYRQYFSVKA